MKMEMEKRSREEAYEMRSKTMENVIFVLECSSLILVVLLEGRGGIVYGY